MNRIARIFAWLIITLVTTVSVLSVCIAFVPTPTINAGILQSAGRIVLVVCFSVVVMLLQSIPALRFYRRRWNDWKHRKDKWLILCEEDEPGQVTWSIAEHFGFPIIHEKTPETDEKVPAVNRFACLPNRLLHIKSAHIDKNEDWRLIDIYIYHPRNKADRMAKSERFELADPDCFDQIGRWLDEHGHNLYRKQRR